MMAGYGLAVLFGEETPWNGRLEMMAMKCKQAKYFNVRL